MNKGTIIILILIAINLVFAIQDVTRWYNWLAVGYCTGAEITMFILNRRHKRELEIGFDYLHRHDGD